MANPLKLPFLEPLTPYGWPIARFVGGILLATHGWAKVFGGGIPKFQEGLAKMGVPAPEVMAWVSALGELVGGTMLAIGFLTRFAGLVVAINMTVALLAAHAGDFGKIGSGGSSPAEYPLLLAAVGVAGLVGGAPRCSVDAMLARRSLSPTPAPSPAPSRVVGRPSPT
jgi:putative oxidoreductase